MHHWYYQTIAEQLELSLNKTGAFKEFIKHINFIWPGSFDSEKARYRKYREVSVEGCKRIGRGAKGDVYRYDDELIIKVESVADHRIESTFVTVKPKVVDEDDDDYDDEDEDENGEKKKKRRNRDKDDDESESDEKTESEKDEE